MTQMVGDGVKRRISRATTRRADLAKKVKRLIASDFNRKAEFRIYYAGDSTRNCVRQLMQSGLR